MVDYWAHPKPVYPAYANLLDKLKGKDFVAASRVNGQWTYKFSGGTSKTYVVWMHPAQSKTIALSSLQAGLTSSHATVTNAVGADLTIMNDQVNLSHEPIFITTTGGGANAPVAHAGSDQTVIGANPVTLDGTASSGNESGLTYAWTRIAGPSIDLSGADTATPSFAAPVNGTNYTLTFQLVVTNTAGTSSDPDTVDIHVLDPDLDADADGLPDAWEVINFGDIALYTANDDPDEGRHQQSTGIRARYGSKRTRSGTG